MMATGNGGGAPVDGDGYAYNVKKSTTNDYILMDVKGCYTNETLPGVFGDLCLPNEKITSEFRVQLEVKELRPFWFKCFMCLISFGVYLIWLYACGCLRAKVVGGRKTRVAVTNMGRVLLWDACVDGIKSPSIPCIGKDTIDVATRFRWFRLRDVTSIQTLVLRDRFLPCSEMCGLLQDSYFKVCVGSAYPAGDEWDMGRTGISKNTMSTHERMNWDGVLNIVGSGVAKVNLFSLLGGSGWSARGSEMIMTVYSGSMHGRWEDKQHPGEDVAWHQGVGFIRSMLDSAPVPTAITALAPVTKNFKVAAVEQKSSPLVEDGRVNINPHECVVLGNGEQVLNALQIHSRMSCFECITCAWLCSRKWSTQTALVLTNKRLISIDACHLAGDVLYEMDSHILGTVHNGFLVKNAKVLVGGVQTAFGSITVEAPIASSKWPCSIPGADKDYEKKFYSFWISLATASSNTRLNIPNVAMPVEQSEIQEVLPHLPYFPGEEMRSILVSENQYNLEPFDGFILCRLLTMNYPPAMRVCVRIATCGMRPWDIKQRLILSTHRAYSVGGVENYPCGPCLCWKQQPTVVSWVRYPDISSSTLDGSYTNKGNTGFFSCPTAHFNYGLGVNNSYSEHPFFVKRRNFRRKQGGNMENDELLHFRKTLAWGVVLSNDLLPSKSISWFSAPGAARVVQGLETAIGGMVSGAAAALGAAMPPRAPFATGHA